MLQSYHHLTFNRIIFYILFMSRAFLIVIELLVYINRADWC